MKTEKCTSVEFNDCRGCAFSRTESCTSYSCLSEDRNDGEAVQYVERTGKLDCQG